MACGASQDAVHLGGHVLPRPRRAEAAAASRKAWRDGGVAGDAGLGAARHRPAPRGPGDDGRQHDPMTPMMNLDDREAVSTVEPGPDPAAARAKLDDPACSTPRLREPVTSSARVFRGDPDRRDSVESETEETRRSLHTLDRPSLLPDVLLGDIVSRLPIKDAACTGRLNNHFAADDPGLLRCVRLGPVECVLRATLLVGYDGSLDDDPESGVAYFDAPLDRAVGRVGQAPATAAALRADAVGAAGGGLLAWVVAARSAQATCSTVRPAGDRNFTDIPVGAFWETTMDWPRPGAPSSCVQQTPTRLSLRGKAHVLTTLQLCAISDQSRAPKASVPKPGHPILDLASTTMPTTVRPPPWPSFLVARCSVRCHCGRLWKPPWPIQLRQQIRYRAVTSADYRGALGALLFYDIPSHQSFHHIPRWLDAQAKAVDNIVIMMLGNKSNLEEQHAVSTGDAEEFAEQEHFFFLESAISVEEPSEIWQWSTKFPNMLAVLLAERGIDAAMDSLDEVERIAADAKPQGTLTTADI
ncbi:unnamed protein product [Miscanthus lutarioriparius]|uniref:Uncharacterized protein n=1 Tax=Miscanthus lutarioriparius TaxID=422564 RepID=A0A811S5D8_9POAL|nr:unnamed protein product [Miscanthus lutarioriparius]